MSFETRRHLEDRCAVDVRADTARAIGWRTREKEKPPVLLPAGLRQLLKIQHLA